MTEAFFLSVRLHFRWFREAFGKRGRSLTPLRPTRLAVLVLLLPGMGLVQAVHWISFLLDEIFFRGYRRTEVRNPVFITGIPRSGTTFVHQTLAADEGQFTTMEAWEAILAPSVTERKLLRAIGALDKRLGRPLQRLVGAISRCFTRSLDDIHAVNLKAPEEDYLTLLPAGGCFIMGLAFPASPDAWQLGRFQDIPDTERNILMNFYRAMLQKHLYAHPGRRLLSKNAAFASWVPDLRFAFPDARFIFCIREPASALSSQLSSVRPGMRLFSTESALDTFSIEFQTVLAHNYRILRDEMLSFLPDHLVILDQKQFREDTGTLLTQAVKRLCMELTPALEDAIRAAAKTSRTYKSPHRHEAVPAKTGPQEFHACVRPLYEEMMAKSLRP